MDKRRRRGELLASTVGKGVYRYPVWQVGNGWHWRVSRTALAVFCVEDPWMRAVFFPSSDARHGGGRALETLRRRDIPVPDP